MSEFKGKIAVGVTLATIAAIGLAVGFEALAPPALQSSTIGQSTLVASISSSSLSSNSPPPTGCAESANPAANPSLATVYRVTSTQAILCITYKFGGAGNTSFSTSVMPWYQTGQGYAEPPQCTDTTCPNVTASVLSADHGVNATISVVYTIASPSNLTGLFIVFHAGCNPFYLALGQDPSTVYQTAWTCGPSNAISGGYRSNNWNATGSTGISTLSVPWN